MIARLKDLARLLVLLVVFVLYLNLAIGSTMTPPASAPVLVDEKAREFVTPPFLQQNPELSLRFTRAMTMLTHEWLGFQRRSHVTMQSAGVRTADR